MDERLRQLYQDRASESDTLAILYVEKSSSKASVTDRFDHLILVIKEDGSSVWGAKHYEVNEWSVAVQTLGVSAVHRALILGNNRRLVEWLLSGKVLFDRNEFLHLLKRKMDEFPMEERKEKIALHFAKLLRRFEEGKAFFQEGQVLDAFNYMMHALRHLARMSITEHGYYPEVTVWEQVRLIEPETYKLLHELVVADEPIEKRVELLLIAIEFSISRKTELGGHHLLQLMKEKQEPWTIQQLIEEPKLADYRIDVELLLNHLVMKKLVKVVLKESKAQGVYHRHYESL